MEASEYPDFGKKIKIILTSRENKLRRLAQTHLTKWFQKVINSWNDMFFVNSDSAGVKHICVNFEYRNRIIT
jgi:hypothetical protein